MNPFKHFTKRKKNEFITILLFTFWPFSAVFSFFHRHRSARYAPSSSKKIISKNPQIVNK